MNTTTLPRTATGDAQPCALGCGRDAAPQQRVCYICTNQAVVAMNEIEKKYGTLCFVEALDVLHNPTSEFAARLRFVRADATAVAAAVVLKHGLGELAANLEAVAAAQPIAAPYPGTINRVPSQPLGGAA